MSENYHEMELWQYESELHEKMEHCTKNPGHSSFFPVSNIFDLQLHLPARYHRTPWLDYINTMINLTVRLMACYTSKDRPNGYPGADLRGKKFGRAGTGRVTRVVRKFWKIDDKTCPCQKCKKCPENARRQWAKFEVLTALHVVYNDEECRYTTCDVGFDSDEKFGKCPKLEGVEVVRSDKSKDLVMIECVTHDQNVCNSLEPMVDSFYDLRRSLQDLCKRSRCDGDMSKVTVVCVSHPHGMSKHITVGEWTGHKDKDPPYKWTYTAETCGGSSGAPVFMLGGHNGLSCTNLSTHSGSPKRGINECGWEGWHL